MFQSLNYEYNDDTSLHETILNDFEYDILWDDNTNHDIPLLKKFNFIDITHMCVIPTVTDVCYSYFSVLGVCLSFQIVNKLFTLNETTKHIVSGILGLGILYWYFNKLIIHCLFLSVLSYGLVRIIINRSSCNMIITILLLFYLTVCEFTFEGKSWSRIRNVQMLIVMKIVSLISDFKNNLISKWPSFIAYIGYLFSIGNCVFGPWINYKSYLEIYKHEQSLSCLIPVFKAVLKSLLAFLISMCYLDWALQNSDTIAFLPMYGKALEFRAGHYFIMFMSESIALASGFFPLTSSSEETVTTNAMKIELPHSLVEVVIYWNVPMHKWLKIYVFNPLHQHGNFLAVIGTYFVSSLLHGLNYQLSGILLSLAFYTYIEQKFRIKLSQRLNACILAKPCKSNCDKHANSTNKFTVRAINFIFGVIALYHLSYLGYLIDLKVDDSLDFFQSFKPWKHQNYSSHWLVLVTYFIYLLL